MESQPLPYKSNSWSYAMELSFCTACMLVFFFCLTSAVSRSSTARGDERGGVGGLSAAGGGRVLVDGDAFLRVPLQLQGFGDAQAGSLRRVAGHYHYVPLTHACLGPLSLGGTLAVMTVEWKREDDANSEGGDGRVSRAHASREDKGVISRALLCSLCAFVITRSPSRTVEDTRE